MAGHPDPGAPPLARARWWKAVSVPVLAGAAIAFVGLVLVAAATARLQALATQPGGFGGVPLEALYAPVVLGERLAGVGGFLGFAGFGLRRRLRLRWIDARRLSTSDRLRMVNWILVGGGILVLAAFAAFAERDALFASVALQRNVEPEDVRNIYTYDLAGDILLGGGFLLGFTGLAVEAADGRSPA